ncbi:MAG: nucleoside deaminase [Firmicutes bacterium]|nr:nucleoside deaminase [Bacillota bacterium]
MDGSVIVKDGSILVRTHDREESESDPTSHAELNAIKLASRAFGRDFRDCTLVSTHEPCPMCATAIIWSGILKKLEIAPDEAPVVTKTENKIVFHSKNFCPTLEACKILGLDTKLICREISEKPTDALVKRLSERLEFRRNYDRLRPQCDYCEEMIVLND